MSVAEIAEKDLPVSEIQGKSADQVEFMPPEPLGGVIIVGQRVSRPLC
jgi:hypothetical protein